MRKIIVSIFVFVIVACSSNKYDNIPFTADESKIISIAIDSLYYQKEIGSSTIKYVAHQYVLIDSTNSDAANIISERFAANEITSKELISNFQTVNAKRYSLVDCFKNENSIKLISLDKYQSYYRNNKNLNDGGMAGFTVFSTEYPHSFGTSVFQVTRVGFSTDNKSAIVGTMHLRGINMGYDYSYLEKAGEKWIIKKIINH